MNIVWVLIAIVNNGHFGNNIVPTLEFTSREKCQAAIYEFVEDAKGKDGRANMRCVRIEK
jgi:hypothetical protein